jgi:Flp pilus assembly protein TadG
MSRLAQSVFLAVFTKFRRDDRGAAMVEFAIVVPLLFTLVFGIVDIGRAYFLYNNLTNAAREGARYGAVQPALTGATTTAIQALVRSKINDAGAATATVNVTYPGASPDRTVKVQIANYPFQPVTYLVLNTANTFTTTAEFRNEYQP